MFIIDKLHFEDIRYNPERGTFEALVHLHDHTGHYTYPVELAAPLHAEFAFLAEGLARKAAEAHEHPPVRALRLHHAPLRVEYTPPLAA